jgi:hypothetical protein
VQRTSTSASNYQTEKFSLRVFGGVGQRPLAPQQYKLFKLNIRIIFSTSDDSFTAPIDDIIIDLTISHQCGFQKRQLQVQHHPLGRQPRTWFQRRYPLRARVMAIRRHVVELLALGQGTFGSCRDARHDGGHQHRAGADRP